VWIAEAKFLLRDSFLYRTKESSTIALTDGEDQLEYRCEREAAMIESKDVFTREEVCSLLGIKSPDAFYETYEGWVMEHHWKATSGFQEETPEWEAASEESGDYTGGALSDAWNAAFKAAVKVLEGAFNLSLEESDDMFTVTSTSWEDSAHEVIQCINGYGLFYFRDVEDLILSGPYVGAKGATLNHLHWIQEWSAVFGDDSPRRAFDRAADYSLRYV
jgi:hypothetical protein